MSEIHRIYCSDKHGRDEGTIETIDGCDVVYVDRVIELSNVTEEQLEAEIEARGYIRCILFPLPDGALRSDAIRALGGEIKYNHPDLITEGIICEEYSDAVMAIKFPIENIDGISDLCFRLAAIPMITNAYSEDGSNELYIFVLPYGAYTCATLASEIYWEGKDFAGEKMTADGHLALRAEMGKNTEEKMVERAADMFQRYGYLDVMPDQVTVTKVSGRNWDCAMPDYYVGSYEDHSIPEIQAWVEGVHELKKAIADPAFVVPAQVKLSYRAVEVLERELTEEEMHPPQPEDYIPGGMPGYPSTPSSGTTTETTETPVEGGTTTETETPATDTPVEEATTPTTEETQEQPVTE